MNWNENGYGLIPFDGIVPGSWNAGGFGDALFGGLPVDGWGAAGWGELAFDVPVEVPVEPEKPKIPDSVKWGLGGWVTPHRNHHHKSRVRLRNEAILLSIVR